MKKVNKKMAAKQEPKRTEEDKYFISEEMVACLHNSQREDEEESDGSYTDSDEECWGPYCSDPWCPECGGHGKPKLTSTPPATECTFCSKPWVQCDCADEEDGGGGAAGGKGEAPAPNP